MIAPLPNGSNGRSPRGQFLPGHPGGPGNPHAKRTAELRAVLLAAVTDDDLRAVVGTLVTLAKAGDMAAIKELLDRVLGKPLAAVSLDVPEPAPWDGQDPEVAAELLRERLEQLRPADPIAATDRLRALLDRHNQEEDSR